jgi:hypothetical protein
MQRLCFALVFLFIGSQAFSQQAAPAAGSVCLPAEHADGVKIRSTVCLVWITYPAYPHHNSETTGQSKSMETEKHTKADRLAVQGSVTAEAVPK